MYHPDQVDQIENHLDTWLQRSDELSDKAVSYPFQEKEARRFATQGLSRRLNYLEHAIQRVFECYPLVREKVDRDGVREAELLLQAFCMNVFGAIDNLAWIWVLERKVLKASGKDLSRTEVVFDGPRSQPLRDSLTPGILKKVEDMSDWFKALRDYRDGIAHQIPIYIPLLIAPEDTDRYNQLGRAVDNAILAKNPLEANRLMHEQEKFGRHGSLMALCDKQVPMHLHPQLVCDLATVVDLGEAIFDELGS